MRATLGLLGFLALALVVPGAGCSLIVDPASESGFKCGDRGFCPSGFVCDEQGDECVRGSPPADADSSEARESDAEESFAPDVNG